MESPLMLPIPRLRLSRNANAYEVPVAGPSRDRLPDTGPPAVDLMEYSDANDRDDDEQPTPKMTSTGSLMEPSETPAARLRALLLRAPASSKSTPMPQRPSHSSDNESDFEPPSGIAHSTPNFARESLKDIFSRALRDPGNTPQKDNIRPRRNSIDASEVEASPRIRRERAKHKLNRKSLSDEEIENPPRSSQRSEASFKSSQAATFDILRERLNSQTQLKDIHFSDFLYEHSLPNDRSNDAATFLQDVNPDPATPPAATSTPQQSLRMSVNSQFPFQSNLMEQDSEMQRAIEGFDSYEADGSGQRPVSFPSSRTRTMEAQTRLELSPSNLHKRSHSTKIPLESVLPRTRSASRTGSPNSASGGALQADDPDRHRDREREWYRPRTPARAHTPELSRRPSHQQFHRSGSPMVGAASSGTLPRPGSSASLRSFDDSSSKGSSFGSQAEYRERLSELERERNIEREREWNKPHSKLPHPPSLSVPSPGGADRTRTRSLIQLDSPQHLSPARNLQRHPSFNSSRASSPASSLSGSHHGNDESEEEEIVHERERNWNAPRPKWTQHSSHRPQSPLHPQSPSGRVRAESLKTSGTKKGESPIHNGQGAAQSASPIVSGSRTGNSATPPARTASPLPPNQPSNSPLSTRHDKPLKHTISRNDSPAPRSLSPLPPTASAKGKIKESERSYTSKNPTISTSRESSSQTPASASRTGLHSAGYSFIRNRTPLPPIELDMESPETTSQSHGKSRLSPSPTGMPANRNSNSVNPSGLPVRSPKATKPSPNSNGLAPPAIDLEPEFHTTPSTPSANIKHFQEEIGDNFSSLNLLSYNCQAVVQENEEAEIGDLSQEHTPTMRTISPPRIETPEYIPPRSPPPPRQNIAANDESRLQKALRNTSSAANTTTQNVLQELSPPPSPPSPQHSHPSHKSFLSTPPRRASFNTSKLEFQTPSPPKNLPELPGPPSSSEGESSDEPSRTPVRDLRSDLATMKTPRPPGAWASTPAPPQRNAEPSSASSGELNNEQINGSSWTPIRELRADLTSTKTPRPPGAWASTPAHAPSLELPTQTSSLLGDTDEECDSGLATPVASLSRASSLPAQTPGPPGAWMATPAARKSILKVRFDTLGGSSYGVPTTDSSRDPLEDATDASARTDGISLNTKSPPGPPKDEAPPRTRTPEPSNPVSPTSRRFQNPSRKSPGIRILDAFGREVVKDEAQPKASSSTRNKIGIRVVDAMGREVDGGEDSDNQPSQGVGDDTEKPPTPLKHGEALIRVRQGLSDLAEGLDAMDRTNEDARIDYTRLQELTSASHAARTARKQLGQAISSNDADLRSKLRPLRMSMKKSGLFMSSAVDSRWPSSWVFWAVLAAQLLLIFMMYRFTITRARDLFLTTYYDSFYPDLHIYTSRPDTLRLSMLSSSGSSWFSVTDTFHREGWKASSRQIWDNLSIIVWDWQQLLWETFDDGATQSSTWPPT